MPPHGSLRASGRPVPLSLSRGYRPYLESFRREISQRASLADRPAPDGHYALPSVTDLAVDWPRIWPLLKKLDRQRLRLEPCEIAADREEFRRAEIEAILATKSRLLLAEINGEPRAVAAARVVANPSVTVERVGLISDVFVGDSDAPGEWRGSPLSRWLLAELAGWLAEKRVDVLETQVLARDEMARQKLAQADYTSHKLELRKELIS